MKTSMLDRSALRAPFVALLLFLAGSAAWSLDLSDGRIRLTLFETTGRFSISCQAKGSSGTFIPLLAAQDPRTTTLSVVVGNKVYRMGESADFSQKIERTDTGGRIVWTSSLLQVTETFTFIAPVGSNISTGVRIDIALKNVSEQDLTVGVRYLFDTYMGESSFIHLRTDTLTQVTHEMAFTAADKVPYWISPLPGDPDDFGLQMITSGQGITAPDRIVFANWKRLSDSTWAFDVSAVRNFSLLPYSINDSAVCQYYDPRPVPRTTEATITLVMGLTSKAGYAAATTPAQDFSVGVQQSLAAAKSATDPTEAVRADLVTVQKLLGEIDKSIDSGSATDAQLSVIDAALKDLESRAPGTSSNASK